MLKKKHFLLHRDIIWWSKLSIFKCCPFLTPVLMRHQWQLKTVVFLHRCLLRAALLLKRCLQRLKFCIIFLKLEHTRLEKPPGVNIIKLYSFVTGNEAQ
jgi:hypothetical protein